MIRLTCVGVKWQLVSMGLLRLVLLGIVGKVGQIHRARLIPLARRVGRLLGLVYGPLAEPFAVAEPDRGTFALKVPRRD
jgi:hypothetical protein